MNRFHFSWLLSLSVTAAVGCDSSDSSDTTVMLATPGESSVEPVRRAAQPPPGYVLVAPFLSTETYLINMDKQVVHKWSADLPGSAAYLLENGDLLRSGRNPDAAIGSRIQRFDWEGNLVWDFDFATEEHRPHHDIAPLPNGNILLIAWEKKTQEQAIEAGRDPQLLSSDGFSPDCVYEIRPTGETTGAVVWEWHMWDHLVQDFDRDKPQYGVIYEQPWRIDINYVGDTPPKTPEELRRLRALGYTGGRDNRREGDGRSRVDWAHTNAIDYNAELDQIALSPKNFCEVWVIDHSTTTQEAAGSEGGRSGRGGDLLYRWGNPWSYKSGTLADKKLFEQHDVRWVPVGYPGEGNIIAFNNGPGRNYSSVIEIKPPLDKDGTYILDEKGVYGPNELVWEYTEEPKSDFYAPQVSGSARLLNGNTLICDGLAGRIFEVNSELVTLWEYRQPYGGSVNRNGQPNDPAAIAEEIIRERRGEPTEAAKQAARERLDRLDRDRDGVVSESEVPEMIRGFMFQRFDQNLDRQLTLRELTAASANVPRDPTAVFRAIKYAPDYPAFAGRQLEPLEPQPIPFGDRVAAEVERLEAQNASVETDATVAEEARLDAENVEAESLPGNVKDEQRK